jgi:hypothetical protein
MGSCNYECSCKPIPVPKDNNSIRSKKYSSGGDRHPKLKMKVNLNSGFQVSPDRIYVDPLPTKQKDADLPRIDISTITLDVFLQKKDEKIFWTNDGKELGVFLKRFIDDDGASCGDKTLDYILQFSEKKWIPEKRLFPPAPDAISSIGGGGGSASTTAKVGGSATIANVGGGTVLSKTIIFTNKNNMANGSNLVVGDSYTDKSFGKDKIGVFVKSEYKDITNIFHVFFLIDGTETEFKVSYGSVLLKIT